MTRWTCSFALYVALVMLLPMSVSAQTIAGTVTDASGAVLPGVTVEASSAALIEQTRTVVTNDAGRFSIVNLRPGAYTVTFTLNGFRTVRREGIELTSDFTATVNAELGVGGVEEVITGRGHRAGRRRPECRRAARLHARHARRAADRSHAGSDPQHHPRHLARLLRHELPRHQRFGDHGRRHARLEPDWRRAEPDHRADQQQHVSGVQLLDEHRQRGSRAVQASASTWCRGTAATSCAARSSAPTRTTDWQSSNIDDNLRSQGLTEPPKTLKLWDFNPSVGGPIARDRALVSDDVSEQRQRHAGDRQLLRRRPVAIRLSSRSDPSRGQQSPAPTASCSG